MRALETAPPGKAAAVTLVVAAPVEAVVGTMIDTVTGYPTVAAAILTTDTPKSSKPSFILMIEAIWLIIAAFLLVILWLIWKIVVTPNVVLTVGTDKPSYNRGEDVIVSGILTGDGTPIAGETISGAVVQPGGGGAQNFTATTQADGSWEYTYPLGTGAAGGTYTVQVAGFGASNSTTFHQINQNVEDALMYRVPYMISM